MMCMTDTTFVRCSLMDIKPEIEAAGARLVAVGNGSAYFAKQFVEGLKFPSDAVYLDKDSAVFKELNLPRLGLLAVCQTDIQWPLVHPFPLSAQPTPVLRAPLIHFYHGKSPASGCISHLSAMSSYGRMGVHVPVQLFRAI